MNVTIRKLENADHQYFAYTKSLCHRATYFVYFTDDIFGAVALNNFVEMLRSFFHSPNVKITIGEKDLHLKNEAFLELLKSDEK